MITSAPAANATRPVVLAVDDDPVALEIVRGTLHPDGYEVVTAPDATAALALLGTDARIDIVVSDLMMPGIAGLELCERVRSDPQRRHLPWLFLTAFADRRVRHDAFAVGADGFLAKPVDDDELLVRVRAMVQVAETRAPAEVRDRLEKVLTTIDEGIAVVDAQGTVVQANDAAVRLLGLDTPMTDLGAHLRRAFLPANPDAVGTGVPARYERRPDAAGGEHIELTRSEEVAGTSIVTVRDITDLVRADSFADLIIAGVNHELRTPLTGIRGTLDLLGTADLDPPFDALVGVAARGAERLDQALRAILDHAVRVTEVPGAPLPLTSDSTAAIVAAATRGLGVTPRLQVEVEGPVAVHGFALRAALREFVANAERHGGDDIAVCIQTDVARRWLRIVVSDDGRGFPPGEAGALFARFYQGDRSGQADGVGLGLATVSTVVTEIGGCVSAERDTTGRTRFTAELPVIGADRG